MRIVFIHVGIPITGNSIDEGPLGGTETALIGVSRELAKDSQNEVYVFTNTPKPGEYSGVHYKTCESLAEWGKDHEIDVLISIRQWIPFWLPLKVKKRVYFSPDAYNQPFLERAFEANFTIENEIVSLPFFTPKDFMPEVDHIFCVGQWQRDTFVSQLGLPAERFFVTGNAIFPQNFKPLTLDQRNPRLMYSSTPFRGLIHLLHYFPEIRQKFSSAELEICSGMGVYGYDQKYDDTQYGELYKALENLGAISHGSIDQKALATIMCQNQIFAYPNIFEETYCISVVEAQAAGLAVVTSNKAALKERITHGVDGFLIDGEPEQSSYKKEFIQITVELLKNNDLWQQISQAAQKTASQQTYDRVAKSWVDFLVQDLTRLTPKEPTGPEFKDQKIDHPGKKNHFIHLTKQTFQTMLKLSFQKFGY